MEFESNYASELFDQFLSANTLRVVLTQFKRICNFLELEPTNFDSFYPRLKKGIANKAQWKAQSIFNKLDKKASNKIYLQNQRHDILKGQKCLIIGGGPCGLRTAIDLQLLGADHVMIVEKRDRISRNNTIRLWPFVIHDLKELACKKINPKFCSGSIDHVSIRQLQMMLLKIALIVGCDFVDNVAFETICPISIQPNLASTSNNDCCCNSHQFSNNQQFDDQSIGAYAHFKYNQSSNYPCITEKLDSYAFNILIGADGRRNLLSDYFARKQFRGRLAIAITANFQNTHTLAETQVPEISGISCIYYQQLFKSLREQTNIDLENICYYKDDCHYMVTTPKKSSLLARGVLIRDYQDTRALLSPENVNQDELLNFARDIAKWTTGLDNLKFALNHYGKEDIAMFDFSTLYCAENACRVKEIYLRTKCCKQQQNTVKTGTLLLSLVGDSLLEPFWPTGSGCGRGFLSSMDAAWFCRQFAMKCLSKDDSAQSIKDNEENILSVIAERESIYRLLAQTKPENLNLNFSQYTLNPVTRYPNLNSMTIMPNQCKHLLYSNVRKTVQSRQTLAEKRARRITIACTPETFKKQYTKQQHEQTEEIEESPEESSYDNHRSNDHQNKSDLNSRITGIEYLNSNKQYMTPSAFNLASLEKSRNKEIESVIKHRKQREERMNQECLSSEERFMNHIRKQIKPKTDWLLNSKTENSYESNTSSNRSNNSSQEDLPMHFTNHFSNKVRDLEYKLNSHNTFNEERYLRNHNSNRHVDGVNVMVARLTLQELLDPVKQEAKFKEEVKRKAFLEKDYKFVGKLTKDDWNVKLFNGDKSEDVRKVDKLADKLKPRPKERIAIFKERLHNIENILTNGKSKTEDEVNRLTKKQLQKFETRSGSQCGSWIEKLKSELNDRQQSSVHKKFATNRPFLRKRSVDEDDHQSEPNDSSKYLVKNPNVHYIKYEKLNKPIITIKQNESKFHSLDRLKSSRDRSSKKPEIFSRLESTHHHQPTYAKDNCSRCHSKVMTIDKINVNGLLFHRNCLKCINCGCNLRLSELRQTNNVIDEKNCICTLCSNETRLTRSNSTSNYSSRLKERMRWKETYLLNSINNQEENSNQIIERVEYEYASTNELLDDEEVTKLLNLDSKDVGSKSSQSSDLLSNQNNSSDEDEESTSDTTDTSDTTGADVNSDQFDLSELDSPKIKEPQTNLPEIIVNNESLSSEEDDEETLNETNQNSNDTSNTLNNAPGNTLNGADFCASIPEKSKTISDINEVDEFDETTDSKLSEGDDKNRTLFNFKVEIPKSFVQQEEGYPKISVLKDRILNYQGTFTEKVLKSRSSPSLTDNSPLSYSNYYNASSPFVKK